MDSQGGRPDPEKKPSIEDFQLFKQVGNGAFGSVFFAQSKLTQEYVAIKTLAKGHVEKTGKTDAVMREKSTLLALKEHPFIIKLKQTLMDEDNLYFIFENCCHGDLSNLIKKTKNGLESEVAVHYAAEIV